MKRTVVLALGGLIELLTVAACTVASPASPPPATLTVPATSVANNRDSATKVPPTPTSPGQAIVDDDLQVSMDMAEFSGEYLTEYGISREPPAGEKFLWIRITLKNLGPQARAVPAVEHFSVLYDTSEFKATYGHRLDHVDYTSLDGLIYTGQSLTAWFRFDIPAAAEWPNLQFAYLPESSRVIFSFSPSHYAWGDHPVYLWRLAP
jgi:hypothetical protein